MLNRPILSTANNSPLRILSSYRQCFKLACCRLKTGLKLGIRKTVAQWPLLLFAPLLMALPTIKLSAFCRQRKNWPRQSLSLFAVTHAHTHSLAVSWPLVLCLNNKGEKNNLQPFLWWAKDTDKLMKAFYFLSNVAMAVEGGEREREREREAILSRRLFIWRC